MLVNQSFDAHVTESPDRVALSVGEEAMTYRQLFDRTEQIGAQLQAHGVVAGDLVGVFLDRSFDLIASFLGILKAGAAYVPLDTNYPSDRLAFMVSDTQMKVVLSSRSLVSRLPGSATPTLEVEWLVGGGGPARRVSQNFSTASDQLAYVMYTSGSTGTPKGVAIPHRGIVRLVQQPDFVTISRDDVFLQVSPVSFDAATFEIWGALTNGARLVLMPPGQPSLKEIGDVIRNSHITTLWLTAGLFNLMVDERLEDLRPVKQLLAGGDVLSVPHVRRALTGLPDTKLINGYGPTENTTFTCCCAIPRDLPAEGSVPIGRPIRGTTVHVVDENLREVSDGTEGELITGGLGLALGYWNRPELTSERFVKASFSDDTNSRFYRTGDQVRRRPDGQFEFLGRKDNQVKLRGFRIELGEIESALRQHPDVRDCAVAVRADPQGNRTLAAWLVGKQKGVKPAVDLRAYSLTRLPDHTIPAFWTWMDELPLNANGKVDRARLPDPAVSEPSTEREPPKNDTERLLVALWQELLGGIPVGVTQSYFDLGASSLQVAQAHERLRSRHGFQVKLADLFQFSSVRRLSDHLQGIETPPADGGRIGTERAAMRATALNRFKKR